MTLTELASHDGQDGRRAYVAVNNTIYDVTESPHWQKGLHPPDHKAGQDLTEDLAKAPHVRAVIERFPVIGTLVEEASERTSGGNRKMVIGIIIATIIAALMLLLML